MHEGYHQETNAVEKHANPGVFTSATVRLQSRQLGYPYPSSSGMVGNPRRPCAAQLRGLQQFLCVCVCVGGGGKEGVSVCLLPLFQQTEY